MPQNLEHLYLNSKIQSAPKFSWQRPTSRYRERQFFTGCGNEIKAFQSRAERRTPNAECRRRIRVSRPPRSALIQRTNGMIANIRMISEGWFGFPIDEPEERGSLWA